VHVEDDVLKKDSLVVVGVEWVVPCYARVSASSKGRWIKISGDSERDCRREGDKGTPKDSGGGD